MSYYTLAISTGSHDASFCLLKDADIVVAIAAERTSRNKHTSAIKTTDLNIVKQYTTHVNKLVLVNSVSREWLNSTNNQETSSVIKKKKAVAELREHSYVAGVVRNAGISFDKLIIDDKNHHMYHAAAGYYTSGLKDALCLVVDGSGSMFHKAEASLFETTSIFYCSDGIHTLYKRLAYRYIPVLSSVGWSVKQLNEVKKEYPHPVDITSHLDVGQMYGSVSRFIGFKFTDAGKTMGLAAYGRPNDLPPMLMENRIESNANFFRNDAQVNAMCYPELIDPSEEIKANLAYNVQKALEVMFVDKVAKALELRYSDNLIISGGCALNILGNSVLKKKFPHLNIYPEPIASDAGQSVGAALYHYKLEFPHTQFKKIDNLYLGPHYEHSTIKQRLLHLLEQHNNESSLPVNSN